IDNTIVWDKRAMDKFAELSPGEGADLSFRLSPLEYAKFALNSRGSVPEIKIKVVTTGERILDSGQVDRVSSTEERTVKVATNLTLSAKLTRNQGNIENSGPIPPKANNKPTSTVF